jgi:hypothetical protein
MPTPTVRDSHVDAILSNISVMYKNPLYIGENIFPLVQVNKKSDLYFVYGRQSWFTNQVSSRAPGTEANIADYSLTTASYVCTDHSIAHLVTDEERNNADSPLTPEFTATDFVSDALLRAQEIRIANRTTGGSGLWAYSASPTTQWSSDSSDPLGDIETAINGVVSSIGRLPNVAVMSWDVWRRLKNHPDILDRIKYTRPGSTARPGDLSDWFGVDKFLVGTQIYDPAMEGQTASPAYIWGDGVWFGWVPDAPSLRTPAAGYVFQWQPRNVQRYRLQTRHADLFECSHSTAEVTAASDAGAILFNVV